VGEEYPSSIDNGEKKNQKLEEKRIKYDRTTSDQISAAAATSATTSPAIADPPSAATPTPTPSLLGVADATGETGFGTVALLAGWGAALGLAAYVDV
jgi:hypothetical protein